MNANDFEQYLEELASNPSGDFEGFKPESLVALAEDALSLRFSPSYRQFLLRLGCGDINGLEIYGVIRDSFVNASIPNGIWLTLELRQSSGLPVDIILFQETGVGGYYAIDLGQSTEDGEAPVVEWIPGADNPRPCPIIAENFGVHLQEQVKAYSED